MPAPTEGWAGLPPALTVMEGTEDWAAPWAVSASASEGMILGRLFSRKLPGAGHRLPDSSPKTRRNRAESQPTVQGGNAAGIVSKMVFSSRLATLSIVFAQETLGIFMSVCVCETIISGCRVPS